MSAPNEPGFFFQTTFVRARGDAETSPLGERFALIRGNSRHSRSNDGSLSNNANPHRNCHHLLFFAKQSPNANGGSPASSRRRSACAESSIGASTIDPRSSTRN